MRKLGYLDEVLELGAHHRGAADRPAQHGLVHDRPDLGRIRPAEQVLALEPQGDPALDLVGGRGLAPEAGDGPRVVLGLEQPVHELDLEAADGRRGGLEPEVLLEPVGQDVAVLRPPVRRVGLLDQREELRPQALVGHAVEGEQVRHVAALELDPAVFQPADLGPGRADFVAGLLGRDAGGLAKAPQLAAEQHAQHGRIDRGVFQARKWLVAIRPHSTHHPLQCRPTGSRASPCRPPSAEIILAHGFRRVAGNAYSGASSARPG